MTKTVDRYFLEAIKAFLDNKSVDWKRKEEQTPIFWNELIRVSQVQNVLPMVYETMYESEAYLACPDVFRQMLRREVYQMVALEAIRTKYFLELYTNLCRNGVCPVIVKGIVCRQLYQKSDFRLSCDEDLYLDREQAWECHTLLTHYGFTTEWDADTTKPVPEEITYINEEKGLRLEVHYELFSEESQAYGEFNSFFQDCLERKVAVNIQGVDIYTMNYTDHFLYLICHAFKHFLHSGFGIRQVCDIIMYANTYGKYIDWDYIWKRTVSIHANIFTMAMFTIGREKLNLNLKAANMTKVWSMQTIDCTSLLEDLLDGGVFGNSSMSRKHSSTMTLNAVTARKHNRQVKTSIMRTIFPDRTYLSGRYPFLKAHGWLLPVAWICRIFVYHKEIRKGLKENNAKQSMEIGSQRIELMKEYKVL